MRGVPRARRASSSTPAGSTGSESFRAARTAISFRSAAA